MGRKKAADAYSRSYSVSVSISICFAVTLACKHVTLVIYCQPYVASFPNCPHGSLLGVLINLCTNNIKTYTVILLLNAWRREARKSGNIGGWAVGPSED